MRLFATIGFCFLLVFSAHAEEEKQNAVHPLLQKAVVHDKPESVGRHFLHALGSGNRKQAEALMIADKGFWNGVTEKDFPFGDEQSSALKAAANGKLEGGFDNVAGAAPTETIIELNIGGIPLAITLNKKTEQWKVFTGYLFSTRHVKGITLPLRLNKALDGKR